MRTLCRKFFPRELKDIDARLNYSILSVEYVRQADDEEEEEEEEGEEEEEDEEQR